MHRHLTSLTVALLLLPAPARAQEIPCQEGPCVRPHDVGSHFLAEVNGGGTVAGGLGLMVGGVFGVGGKLRALPFRFYLVGEFAYSSSTEDGWSTTLGASFRDQRARRDLGGGLRIYLPIYGPLRLFGDVVAGASYVSATLEREGAPPVQSGGWGLLVATAVGLQVRVISQLSLGARVRFALTGEHADDLRAQTGSSSMRPITCMAGMTWHF